VRVTVFGSARIPAGSPDYEDAKRLGQRLADRGDALIALPGGAGTLGEVALAWNLRQMGLMSPKPVIVVGQGWKRMLDAFRANLVVDERDIALLRAVDSVDEAVAALEDSAHVRADWYG